MDYKIQPPKASKSPFVLKNHGDIRIDNYHWMRLTDSQKDAKIPDKNTKRVIDYLRAENSYFKTQTKHTDSFKKSLFEEMKGRIKEEDSSVPYKKNGYFYITKYKKGKQYPIYTRKKNSLKSKEEILFDVNKMAEGLEYYNLGAFSVSPDNTKVVYGVDTVSRRQYTLYVKDLSTGKIFEENIINTTGRGIWANDNKTIFYTKKDPITLRNNKIFKHTLGTKPSEDVLVFEEKDESFGTSITKSKSMQFLIICSFSTNSTEYQVLDADAHNGNFRIVQKRENNLEYSIEHFNENFYILTNKDGASNFKLMKTSIKNTSKENWVDVIPHRENVLIEDISVFKDHLVIEERKNGLSLIRIKKWDNSEDYYIPFKEETYSVYVLPNSYFDTNIIRYQYSSMTTPTSVIDFNMTNKSKEIKKEQEILGGKFNKNNYISERVWVTARDNKKIAVSLVRRKDTELSPKTPFLLYGYGAYGHTIDPSFSTTRISLLDRGFIFGIAHVRGGEYLGRRWYEDGKLLTKMNTFTDFIDCSKKLISLNYTSKKHLYAMGGSAGGLLIGAIINMNPELYNGIVAAVPFVDVISTMLDKTIPLTTGEYEEWGDPNGKKYYDYIKTYSPYDNVSAFKYPNILVTTGFHDSQVQYWEPAKWVAKLRELSTSNNKILLHTDMKTGHGGPSGRFDAIKEIATDYTFLLDLEGKINPPKKTL